MKLLAILSAAIALLQRLRGLPDETVALKKEIADLKAANADLAQKLADALADDKADDEAIAAAQAAADKAKADAEAALTLADEAEKAKAAIVAEVAVLEAEGAKLDEELKKFPPIEEDPAAAK